MTPQISPFSAATSAKLELSNLKQNCKNIRNINCLLVCFYLKNVHFLKFTKKRENLQKVSQCTQELWEEKTGIYTCKEVCDSTLKLYLSA